MGDENYHPILVPTALWKAFRDDMLKIATEQAGERDRRERERKSESKRRDEST